MLQIARDALVAYADEVHAKTLQRFFKTDPGEYGEGDHLIGVRVPDIRRVAKMVKDLSLDDTQTLLHSETHEERLLALIILTERDRHRHPDVCLCDCLVADNRCFDALRCQRGPAILTEIISFSNNSPSQSTKRVTAASILHKTLISRAFLGHGA